MRAVECQSAVILEKRAFADISGHRRGGRLPFPEVNAFEKDWLRRRPPADLSMLAQAERPIIDRALSTVPLYRWRSCQEMMSRLSAVHS
jgi:hypothetical protein